MYNLAELVQIVTFVQLAKIVRLNKMHIPLNAPTSYNGYSQENTIERCKMFKVNKN